MATEKMVEIRHDGKDARVVAGEVMYPGETRKVPGYVVNQLLREVPSSEFAILVPADGTATPPITLESEDPAPAPTGKGKKNG